MAVFQVKKYKIIKDDKGNKIKVPKTKEEWNRETRNGNMIWYFYDRYVFNDKVKQYKSKVFSLKRNAEEEERLFLSNPLKYIQEHSKKAKNNLIEYNYNIQDTPYKMLDDYYYDYFEYDYSIHKESTAYDHKTNYFKHISPLLGEDDPSKIDITRINYYHEEIDKKELAHSTKVNINSALTGFLDFLIKKGVIKINYAKIYGSFKKSNDEVVSIEKKIKFQTLEQFNFFMKNIHSKFWYALFNFTFWHGIRKGELQALRWKDIDFVKKLVVINKTISKSKTGGVKITNTKNRKSRVIYLAEQSVKPLQDLYQIVSKLDGFNDNWFVFGRGENITDIIARNTIDRFLSNAYKELKKKFPEKENEIVVLTHHEFGRHSHASHLLNLGLGRIDIYDIIALRLGDTVEVIRNTYAHPYENVNNDKTKELLNLRKE